MDELKESPTVMLGLKSAWWEMYLRWKDHKWDDEWNVMTDRNGNWGLCATLVDLRDEGLITENTYAKMKELIPEPVSGVFVWPLTLTGAEKRIDYCNRMWWYTL